MSILHLIFLMINYFISNYKSQTLFHAQKASDNGDSLCDREATL